MSSPASPGADLLDKARAGDARALERLLVVCRPDLQRYARRHCQSQDIEDAVQDSLWILYRKLDGLHSVAAFSGWLFQVVRRACLGYVRRRAAAHLPLEAISEAAQTDWSASDAELRSILSSIIAGLPPTYRDVLLLRDVQGLSSDELAATLDISPEAAKSRLHRARYMVREALSDMTPDRVRGEAA